MKLFRSTFKYRLKHLFTSARGLVFFALALLIAAAPFIGLIIPDAPVPIGWIDEDNTEFSRLLLKNVEELKVVWVTTGDEATLTANLQTGRLEGVFVIKKGFEQSIKNGEFGNTLKLLRSPYSTAAGVISESVGGEAMRLWATCYSAKEAEKLGGEELYKKVFEETNAGTDNPILSIERINEAGSTKEVTPIMDAAFTSLYLLCALVCFFMLTGLTVSGRETDFSARLKSRAFSMELFRLSTAVADTVYILPIAAVPLVAFGIAGAEEIIAPMAVMFALYLVSYGGVASLIAKINNQTVLMLLISVITIANVMFGSLLVKLPSGGALNMVTYLLPSRWLSSIKTLDPALCVAGLVGCAVVYNVLPFVIRRKEV
ncbi:MAG: ABC transporter permease [Burkholderiales bacterium]